MKALAWTLFLVGTLLASAAGAHLPPIWPVFGLGIVLSVAGAVLLRRAGGATGGGTAAGPGIHDLAALRGALGALQGRVAGLDGRPVDEALKADLETILLDELMPVVAARGLVQQAHGVETHARVFTPVATAERCLNRAWSALVDGVPDEASAELGKAAAHLDEAVGALPA